MSVDGFAMYFLVTPTLMFNTYENNLTEHSSTMAIGYETTSWTKELSLMFQCMEGSTAMVTLLFDTKKHGIMYIYISTITHFWVMVLSASDLKHMFFPPAYRQNGVVRKTSACTEAQRHIGRLLVLPGKDQKHLRRFTHPTWKHYDSWRSKKKFCLTDASSCFRPHPIATTYHKY